MPSLLEQIAAAKRRGIRSAPQNAVLSHAAQGFQTQGFQNHIPARGRKRKSSSVGVVLRISKPHPRKGTETTTKRQNAAINLKFQNHIPARGRKREGQKTILDRYRISKPHPRKGTETFIFTDGTRAPSRYFKTTSPQGDGNGCVIEAFHDIPPIHFKTTSPQGDGNNHLNPLLSFPALHNFKTTSP